MCCYGGTGRCLSCFFYHVPWQLDDIAPIGLVVERILLCWGAYRRKDKASVDCAAGAGFMENLDK